MNVAVVSSGDTDNGDFIAGIFSSNELAEDYVAEMAKNPKCGEYKIRNYPLDERVGSKVLNCYEVTLTLNGKPKYNERVVNFEPDEPHELGMVVNDFETVGYSVVSKERALELAKEATERPR